MSLQLADATDALFEVDGSRIVPSDLTQGPWDPRHQHGGAVAGLLGHLAEQHPTPVPMRIVRMTTELMRGVPVDTLTSRVDELRNGKRVQLVRVTLLHGDLDVAQATVLKLRVGEDDLVPVDPDRSRHTDDELPPAIDAGQPAVRLGQLPDGTALPGFVRAVDMNRVIGHNNTGAPSATWMRLRTQLIRGIEPSAFVRFATLGDFVSGSAQYLDYQRWITINPDLTYYLWREMVGEWLAVRTVAKNQHDGIGMSEGVFYDETGRIGRGVSSTLIMPR